MPTLSIRNLPPEVYSALRVRAAKRGRSMEAEARAILTEMCHDETPATTVEEVQRWIDDLYRDRKPDHEVDEFLRWRREEAWGK